MLPLKDTGYSQVKKRSPLTADELAAHVTRYRPAFVDPELHAAAQVQAYLYPCLSRLVGCHANVFLLLPP